MQSRATGGPHRREEPVLLLLPFASQLYGEHPNSPPGDMAAAHLRGWRRWEGAGGRKVAGGRGEYSAVEEGTCRLKDQ